MKNFRNNLHSAFFNIDAYKSAPESQEVKLERELNDLKKPILDEFKTSTNNFLAGVNDMREERITSRYADSRRLREDHRRFITRINAPKGKQKYSDIWNENITTGFWRLITALKEAKYFEGKDLKSETAKIKEQYWKEVEDQYISDVWFAGDKKFGRVKDDLFWENSQNYPADKIYRKLTWAATIIRREKTKVRSYDIDVASKKTEVGKDASWNDKVEVSPTTKQRIQFLAHDLPNYLWEVKDKTALQKIGNRLPFIKYRVDKPSLFDKKQLEIFIKAADELGGENPELKLLKVFHELDNNEWDKKIREALGLSEDKSIKNIKRAFHFYNSTQQAGLKAESQHALYLSIISIIEKQWWFDKTISAFKEDVESYKNKQNTEWKEYKKGEKLDKNLKDFADKLWITDYTSATRLSKKTEEDFEKADVVDILADLNNDGILTFSDNWLTKTWLQFKEIYNVLWENVALNNLLNAAKLKNKGLINSPLKDADFTKEQIKKWNKELILLLQNIISNPWVDLTDLMTYGADSSERFADAAKLLKVADKEKDKAADELLRGIDLTQVKIDGVEVASAEWLHQAVAWALYAEYARWVGLWWRISFDQWVKWISLNGGIQASDKWGDVWLTLAYNREINLWKWWSINPGASIGFVPMFKCGASEWVEIAKKWITNNLVQNKVWVRVSFSQVAWWVQVYSAFVWLEKDYVAWIEWSRREIESLFKDKIVSPLFDSIATEFKGREFDLSKQENINKVRILIAEQVKKLYEWDNNKLNNKEEMDAMISNTINFLENYNKSPIQDKWVRDLIINEMANSYSIAWAEQNKHKLEGKIKFTDAMVGASWVSVWAAWALVLHAWVWFTKYVKDIYADGSFRIHRIEVPESLKNKKKWDKEWLDRLNQFIPEGSKFGLVEVWQWENKKTYIKIPAKAIESCDVLINPWMKWLIKKEGENILLSDETVLEFAKLMGAARTMTRITIGWTEKNNPPIKLNSAVMNDSTWFAAWEIDTSKLTGREKAEVQNNQKLDIMSKNVRAIADKVYAEAFKVTSNKLFLISHERIPVKGQVINELRRDYKEFAGNVKAQNYPGAKDILLGKDNKKGMLSRMDEYIEGAKFSSIEKDLRDIDEKELWQVLLSINNIFARVSSVHGWNDGEYHFKKYRNGEALNRSMGDVISGELGRANEIRRKVETSGLNDDIKKAYQKLIDFAENHRKNNSGEYSKESQKGRVYEWAIWINLWNAISLENPLFNPEIYVSPVIDSDKLNFEWKDVLRKHLMEDVIIKNKALSQPILSKLWVELKDGDDLSKHASYDEKTWKIKLDIDWKNVILSADMKFGYFAQCVNHMLLLDNITAEIPGQGSVTFNSSFIKNGTLMETTASESLWKYKAGGYIAATVHRENPEPVSSTPEAILEDHKEIENPDVANENKQPIEISWWDRDS